MTALRRAVDKVHYHRARRQLSSGAYDLSALEWLLAGAGWRLVEGDEQISAAFRRGEPRAVDLAGNFERNLAAARELG